MQSLQTTIRNKKIQFIRQVHISFRPETKKQTEAMSTWDAMKEVAKEEARKGTTKI